MNPLDAARSMFHGLARHAVAAARRPWGRARFRREIARSREPLRIVIGAGRRPVAGWINTDVGPRARLYLNATRPWPVSPNSVAYVYGDNVIEHFSMPDARKVLRNTFKALAPGGTVRLATPDVERTARIYLDDATTAARHMERHRRTGYEIWHPVDLLRVTFVTHGHHLGYLWDYHSLSSELLDAGFENVERHECGASAIPELRDLESRTAETESVTTLVVEARKPLGSGRGAEDNL